MFNFGFTGIADFQKNTKVLGREVGTEFLNSENGAYGISCAQLLVPQKILENIVCRLWPQTDYP